MDFERIDINQCPKGEGNKGPNRFANTARCKTETTEVGKNDLLLCQQKFNYLFFSVSRLMVGDSGGAGINAVVSPSIDYPA